MYGLSASIWCKDVSLANNIADQLNAGWGSSNLTQYITYFKIKLENVTPALSSQQICAKLAAVVWVLQNKQNLVISRCYLAEDDTWQKL